MRSNVSKIHDNWFISAYTETFPFDGANVVDKNCENWIKKDGIAHPQDKALMQNYMEHRITLITSFFGIPNGFTDFTRQQVELNQKRYHKNQMPPPQSWRNIAHNLFFVPDENASMLKTVLYIIASILPAIFYLVTKILPTTLINCVKLFTEFPLTAARDYFDSLKENTFIEGRIEGKKPNLFVLGVAHIGSFTANFLLFFVRAITSPVKNARFAWETKSKFGVPAAVLLTALSMAVTIIAYTILFPLGIKFVTTQALPWVGAKLSGAIAKGATSLVKAMPSINTYVSQHIPPIIVNVGSALNPYVKPVFSTLGLNLSDAALGLSLMASSLGMFIGGTIINAKINLAIYRANKRINSTTNFLSDFNSKAAERYESTHAAAKNTMKESNRLETKEKHSPKVEVKTNSSSTSPSDGRKIVETNPYPIEHAFFPPADEHDKAQPMNAAIVNNGYALD